MDKVQINTNKQNEYIAQLERRIENLTGFADIIGVSNFSIEELENKVQALQDIYAGHKTEIKNNTNDGVIEDLTKRVEFLEQYDYSKEIDDINTEIVHHGDWLSGHDTELATFRSQLKDQADKLAAMQVRLDAQLTHICEHRGNGNVLRALHQLLGALV
jgi:chromosome segregation ATPase